MLHMWFECAFFNAIVCGVIRSYAGVQGFKPRAVKLALFSYLIEFLYILRCVFVRSYFPLSTGAGPMVGAGSCTVPYNEEVESFNRMIACIARVLQFRLLHYSRDGPNARIA